MITIVDEDIETVGDNIIPISPLDSLSEELLNETIDTQLKNPYLASTNCVAEFNELYEYAKEDAINEDDERFVRNTADDFYCRLVEKIDKKFNLGIEETLFGELSLENKANIAEALYSFFVIEYATNVKSYFIKVIEANFDDICDPLRQSKIVLSFHAHADVAYLFVDGLVCAFAKVISVNNSPLSSTGAEIFISVSGDEFAETFASVEKIDLSPEVYKTVWGWGTCEANNSKELGLNNSEVLESNGLVVFER